MLAEEQIREGADGTSFAPGAGGWPTIRGEPGLLQSRKAARAASEGFLGRRGRRGRGDYVGPRKGDFSTLSRGVLGLSRRPSRGNLDAVSRAISRRVSRIVSRIVSRPLWGCLEDRLEAVFKTVEDRLSLARLEAVSRPSRGPSSGASRVHREGRRERAFLWTVSKTVSRAAPSSGPSSGPPRGPSGFVSKTVLGPSRVSSRRPSRRPCRGRLGSVPHAVSKAVKEGPREAYQEGRILERDRLLDRPEGRLVGTVSKRQACQCLAVRFSRGKQLRRLL